MPHGALTAGFPKLGSTDCSIYNANGPSKSYERGAPREAEAHALAKISAGKYAPAADGR